MIKRFIFLISFLTFVSTGFYMRYVDKMNRYEELFNSKIENTVEMLDVYYTELSSNQYEEDNKMKVTIDDFRDIISFQKKELEETKVGYDYFSKEQQELYDYAIYVLNISYEMTSKMYQSFEAYQNSTLHYDGELDMWFEFYNYTTIVNRLQFMHINLYQTDSSATLPELNYHNIQIRKNTMSFHYEIEHPSFNLNKADVYVYNQQNEIIKEMNITLTSKKSSKGGFTVEQLSFDKEYKVVIIGLVHIKDHHFEKYELASFKFKTELPTPAVASIINPVAEDGQIKFDLMITDPDHTLKNVDVRLGVKDVDNSWFGIDSSLIKINELNEGLIMKGLGIGLLGDCYYELEIYGLYQEGFGHIYSTHDIILDDYHFYMDDWREVPSAAISNVNIGEENITFDYKVQDPYDALFGFSVLLSDGNNTDDVIIKSVNDLLFNIQYSFNGTISIPINSLSIDVSNISSLQLSGKYFHYRYEDRGGFDNGLISEAVLLNS